jgi:hypothetical protein
MPTTEGHVRTDRPSRYLVQLCRHADHMRERQEHGSPEVRRVEWSENQGTVELDQGTWTLVAAEDVLTVRVEAVDDENLQRMRSLLADRLEQIGRRDRLAVCWQGEAPPPSRRRVGPWLVGAAVVAVVAVHVAAGGAALAASSWTVWSAVGVGVLLLVKLLVVRGLGRHAVSRIVHRRAARTPR